MNTNRNKMGGVGIYLVVIAVIAVLYFALARLSPSSSSYSYSNFLWDVQNGYVSSVLIKQNSEVPTGVLSITKTDNGEELLNVSDVHEIEQLLLDNNIRYTLKDVTRDSVWITTILPFGICLVIIIVIMMMTNRQAGGGGGAKKLVRRHPNVFGDEEMSRTPGEGLSVWKRVKKEEKLGRLKEYEKMYEQGKIPLKALEKQREKCRILEAQEGAE